MRGVPASIALALLASACGASSFTCQDDAQCMDGSVAGTCQVSGFCSFPDGVCPSGDRYGDRAGDGLAGECVGLDGSTTSTSSQSGSEESITLDMTGIDPSDSSSAPPSTTSSVTQSSADTSVSTTGAVCPPDWHDCSFGFRRRITPIAINGAVVVDFPVRIGLDRSFDWSHAADDGADVRFFADDGAPIPHELERWSMGIAAEIWLRLPTLGGDASELVWMYYGSATPSPALDPADVWSNGYLAVWHMQTGEDSLGSYDLDDMNTLVADGRIGFAQEFDGATSRMTNADMADPFTDGATITAWILPSGWGTNNLGRIADMRETTPTGDGWSFHMNNLDLPVGTLRFTERQGTTQYTATTPGESIVLDTWQHVGIAYRHADPVVDAQMYIDGVVADTSTPTLGTAPAVDSTASFTIGALAGGADRFFAGTIDEYRIAAGLRDEIWIAYEYASVTSGLVELGDEEAW